MILTNARSLSPKICSLIDLYDERKIDFGIVTESWLVDGPILANDVIDLEGMSNLSLIYKNRSKKRQDGRTTRGGGVAFIYNPARASFKERKMKRSVVELLCVQGTISGCRDRIFVFGIYIEPRTTVESLREVEEVLRDEILKIKASNKNPMIFVAGDMNKRDISEAFDVLPSMALMNFEATRGSSRLDEIYSNADRTTSRAENSRPLSTERGDESDHDVVILTCKIEKPPPRLWIKVSRRKRTQKADEAFAEFLRSTDWASLLLGKPLNEMVRTYKEIIEKKTDELFPIVVSKRRVGDPPWITGGIRRKIKQRKRVYRREGRRSLWKRLKALTDSMISEKKTQWLQNVTKQGGGNHTKRYFNAIKMLSNKEKPPDWELTDLFPEKTVEEVLETTADFFGSITSAFKPIDLNGKPPHPLPSVTEGQVRDMLRSAKKPNSTVPGDMLPHLMK